MMLRCCGSAVEAARVGHYFIGSGKRVDWRVWDVFTPMTRE
jgi:hypothetical protein